MKKTLYTPLLTAALLLAASCANDPVEEVLNPSAPGTHLPGDTFIIDYAASTGEADTRADANQRIQSLDYLVYQSTDGGTTYTLLKRRAIPDINTGTQWPLTRETMTWAQREALKDTLNTSCMYKMVFVANAADWIWKSENATPPTNDALENSSDIVLQHANLPMDGTEAPKFEDGRLILPPRVFTEKDMYYMETVEVDGKRYTEEKTAYKNVLLKRMINKVEVRLADEVVNGIETTGSVDKYVENELGKFYDDNYVNDNNGGALDNTVWNYVGELDKVLDILGSSMLPNYVTTKYFKENYIQSDAKIKAIVDDINQCSDDGLCTTDNPVCVKHTFIKNTKDNYKKSCDWSTLTKIEISYEALSYPQAINFDKETVNDGSTTGTIIAIADEAHHCTFYTFGNNETGNEQSMNKIKSMTFKKEDGTILFTLDNINIIPGYELTQGNRHILLIYNPSSAKQVSEDKTFSFTRTGYNLQKVWDWDYEKESGTATTPGFYFISWNENDFEKWLNDGLHKIGVSETEEFNNMTLELNIPSLELKDPWSTEEYKTATTE